MDPIIIILIVTAITSFIGFQNPGFLYQLMMRPYDVVHHKQLYRTITSGFIHVDWLHLGINMFVLYSFGQGLLMYYGAVFGDSAIMHFWILYLGGILVSDLPSLFKHRNNPHFNSLGASGAVSAVLFAYIFFNPLGKVYVFALLPLPGIIWGLLYVAYSIHMSKRGGDNINHDAHLFGAVFGIAYTWAVEPALAQRFIDNITSFFQ